MSKLPLYFAVFLFTIPSFAEVTSGRTTHRTSQYHINRNQQLLQRQILCGFEQNGTNRTPRQQTRAQYVSKAWSEVLSRIVPKINSNGISHMVAQTVSETSSLRLLSEQRSKYASSRKLHKGRGTMQTTHKDNYAKLAGCASVIKNNPPPTQITQEMIAEAKPQRRSPIVKNPATAMSEKTESGRQLNALSAVCYMIDTANRHPRFARALNGDSPTDVREVGVGINRGPGALGKGKKPLNDKGRKNAFNKAERCEKIGPA